MNTFRLENTKKAVQLLWIVLVVGIAMYAILGFTTMMTGGFLALISFIVTIGLSIWAIILLREQSLEVKKFDKNSGSGEDSVVPEQIKKWNWGAAGNAIVWGLSYNIWWALLAFIPYVNILVIIFMGLKGNEWAWQRVKWQSVDEFEAVQSEFDLIGKVSLAYMILTMLLTFIA